jgi:hypothetical protein
LGKLLSRSQSLLPADELQVYLITFVDKGPGVTAASFRPQSLLSDRAIKRRLKVRQERGLLDQADVPVVESYVDLVQERVASVRHRLKWFNAVSVLATPGQIEDVRMLAVVKEVELVGRWSINRDIETPSDRGEASPPAPAGTTSLNYGASFTQVNQINVPPLHDMGIYGQGVLVGVFDNGFRLLKHQAFGNLHIAATYDFVDHKTSVVPINTSTSFGSHGINTLSTIGGYAPGNLIGPAFGADYILARTENDSSETPVEEDNWAAAIEWADSIGVEVTSTSLGYIGYDAPYPGWTWEDMDGNTTLITRAADRAAGLGIVVVNSAGNEGTNSTHNTLGAPSDGDSVIAVGAVSSSGARVSFSSVGNTTDIPNRIKPDIMAMGSGVRAASATNTSQYTSVDGTSFSCPLSAGVAALVLCANPTLTPMQVRNALRSTASQSSTPDRFMGWGIINALAAANYYGIIPHGTLRGVVFHDFDANGIQEAGDLPLAGRMVRLTGSATDSVLTDGNGEYVFAELGNGSFTVTVDEGANWIPSTPPTNQYSATLASFDTTVANLNFGLYQHVLVQGVVYEDINYNGVRDSSESGLSGWSVNLSGDASQQTLTDSAGHYSFTGLMPGTYATSEIADSGWVQMAPPAAAAHAFGYLVSGSDTSGDFGLYFGGQATYPVNAGWNLLSLPRGVADRSVPAVYPGASSRAFTYDHGFQPSDFLPERGGYWIKFESAQNALIDGSIRFEDTVAVKQGWNLIGTGSFAIPVANIIQVPDGIVGSPFYEFNSGYGAATQLEPHAGYWVKTDQDGSLILPSSTAQQSARHR